MNDRPSIESNQHPSPHRAGFFVRLAAYLIDVGVIWYSTSLVKPLARTFLPGAQAYLREILLGATGARMGSQVQQVISLSEATVAMSVVTSLYFLAEALFGRSLGKLAFGLRIDRSSASSGPYQSPQGAWLLRYFIKNAGPLLLLIGLSGHVYAIYRTGEILLQITLVGCLVAVQRRRQALHDLISGTTVIRAPRFASVRASVAA
jgi:uncharacterized RDD family membrane protein YckC